MYIYHEFGKMGEDIAANYLTKNNYKCQLYSRA